MTDEKLDDLLDKRDWVVFADGTELTVDVPSKQTVLNYKFESILDWKLTTESEWLEIDPTNGKAGKDIKIQIKVSKNKDKEGRTGYVDLTLSNDESYRITVNQAGEAAFLGDSAIATITFAEESVLDTIGKEAFRNCSKVRFVEIPNSVTVIAESAFSGCVSLVNAILGTGMQSIGNTAFYGCNRLGIVYSNAIEPPMLGEEVFDDCAEELTIYVPSSSLADYKAKWVAYVRKIVISELE